MDLPANLIYTTDRDPGFSRRGAGTGFAYYDPTGTLLPDGEIKERLKSLALPPAYHDVWYCAEENGHLQATGLDDRDRKQYRYHEDWSAWRNAQKFAGLADFGHALPSLRGKVNRCLKGSGLGKERVVAAVIKLLDRTAIRIGNEVYYEENGTCGLTTLREDNVEVDGDGHLELEFTAKGGEEREFTLYQPRLAKIIDKLEDLPGQRLFTYKDGENLHPVDSSDVNNALEELTGKRFTAKDFRTWRASQLTLAHLAFQPQVESQRELIAQEKEALKATSSQLGHRPPVCRKHYVHPRILELHRAGTLQSWAAKTKDIKAPGGLNKDEQRLLQFLAEEAPSSSFSAI